jgi:hypothetical protein
MTNFPEILCERDVFRDFPVFKHFSVSQSRGSFHSSPSSHKPSDLKCLSYTFGPSHQQPLFGSPQQLHIRSTIMYELQDLLLIFDLITLTSLHVELGWCSLSNFLQLPVTSSLLGPSTLQSAILRPSL